jgi:ribose transport system substrate-binding protein
LFTVVQIRKQLLTSSLLAGSLLFSFGCGRSHPRTVAVIPETTANELWEAAHAGVETAAIGTKWQVFWNGPSREDDVQRQIALVEHAIDAEDGGLILAPDHAVALTTLVHRAVSRGIPTVIVGSPLSVPPIARLAYIINDDAQGGVLAADRIGQLFSGARTVAVLGINPDIIGSVQRAAAFKHRLNERFPSVHVVEELPGTFRLGQAEQDSEDVLNRYPKLDAMFTVDMNATRGAYIALKIKQRSKAVKLIGCDQDLDLLLYLRRGEIDSIVVQNTYQMGYRALNLIKSTVHGADISGVLRLSPLLVTRDNVDQPEVQQMLSMNWRPDK